jgi:excisionase family DNA binding protein
MGSKDCVIDRKRQLTIPQTADRLGISRRTAWAWASEGRLPVTRIGRCVRVPEHALEEMIERATIPARNK